MVHLKKSEFLYLERELYMATVNGQLLLVDINSR